MFNDYEPNMACKKLSLKYRSGISKKNNKEWSGVFIGIQYGNLWLNARPLFFPQGDSDSDLKTEAEIFRVFDHIAETYLTSAVCKEIKETATTLKEYFEYMEKELQDIKYWQKQIYVKLLPDASGESRFGAMPFLSTKPNMSYTDAEKALVADSITHDQKIPKYNSGAAVAADVEDTDDGSSLPF